MRDIQRKKRSLLKIKVNQYEWLNNFQMKISSNLGIEVEGNGGGAYPKENLNVNLQSIDVTSPLIAN